MPHSVRLASASPCSIAEGKHPYEGSVLLWQDQGNNNLALSQTIPAPGGANNSDFGRRVSPKS